MKGVAATGTDDVNHAILLEKVVDPLFRLRDPTIDTLRTAGEHGKCEFASDPPTDRSGRSLITTLRAATVSTKPISVFARDREPRRDRVRWLPSGTAATFPSTTARLSNQE